MSRKTIITCAVTGSAHTPSMSPYLPYTPADIARQAIDAAAAGAAVVHRHARDPDDGRPTSSGQVYREAVDRIRQECDVIINITTSGPSEPQQRMEGAVECAAEMASLNMGSMSPMGRSSMGSKIKEFKFEWEKSFFTNDKEKIYRNTEGTIETIARELSERGTRLECECYDVGHLYNVAYFADKGILKAPLIIQTVFGFSSGIGVDAANVLHMRTIGNQLFGDQWHWSVLAAGRHQTRLCAMAAAMGANVRVGMEDNLYLRKGQLAKSNAEQVAQMRQILELMSLEVSTAAEAREALDLRPGAERS
jgi:uncharacterized protein (DUF849 family)